MSYMKTGPHSKFTLNLDPKTRTRLDALGRASDRSTGSIVRLALRGFLDAADDADLLASRARLLKCGRPRNRSKVPSAMK